MRACFRFFSGDPTPSFVLKRTGKKIRYVQLAKHLAAIRRETATS
jgi:hypothetical protein